MNAYLKYVVILILFVPLLVIPVSQVRGAGPLISEIGNKHNLSSVGRELNSTALVSNTNLYRAEGDISSVNANISGRQVCIFCHTPHNANVSEQAPLWSRKFSSVLNFQRYSSATLLIRTNSATRTLAQYNAGVQPDGSSKLCLSCHDGISKLGVILKGNITMRGGQGSSTAGGGDVISGRASFNPSTNKMKTGHHPVSFVYNAAVAASINTSGKIDYTTSTLPDFVKVDRKNGKMQCTTCHNPHQNQSNDNECFDRTETSVAACGFQNMSSRKVAPFWVYGTNNAAADRLAVCQSCHPMTLGSVPVWQSPSP